MFKGPLSSGGPCYIPLSGDPYSISPASGPEVRVILHEHFVEIWVFHKGALQAFPTPAWIICSNRTTPPSGRHWGCRKKTSCSECHVATMFVFTQIVCAQNRTNAPNRKHQTNEIISFCYLECCRSEHLRLSTVSFDVFSTVGLRSPEHRVRSDMLRILLREPGGWFISCFVEIVQNIIKTLRKQTAFCVFFFAQVSSVAFARKLFFSICDFLPILSMLLPLLASEAPNIESGVTFYAFWSESSGDVL